jgi:hypothetical protein
MGSSTRNTILPRTADELIDVADLRAAIAEALDAVPIDDEQLRRAVWTFVDTERHAGTTAGEVIVALKNLMTQAQVAALSERSAAVILWCVEAYFGHLGGDLRRSQSPVMPSEPRPASRR